LFYHVNDPTGTSLVLVDENGDEDGRILYDSFGMVMENTLSAELTGALLDMPDAATGLVHLSGGRWYDPALGRPLQPNPAGGPPTLPQALNRYAATPVGQSGVANATTTSSGFAISVAKNVASNMLSYAVAETLGNTIEQAVTSVQQIGKVHITANNALLKRAGVSQFFTRTSGSSRAIEYTSTEVLELGLGRYSALTDGTIIDLAEMSSQGNPGWQLSYGDEPFELLREVSEESIVVTTVNTFFRDFAWNAGIAAAIETPFFINNVLSDPYLTSQQKVLQAGITGLGIGGAGAIGAGVGYAFGNVPGAIAGFVVGLGYEYILVPYVIQPVIYNVTGIDPYARTRQLAPLGQGGQ
jgi:hypothetical protein